MLRAPGERYQLSLRRLLDARRCDGRRRLRAVPSAGAISTSVLRNRSRRAVSTARRAVFSSTPMSRSFWNSTASGVSSGPCIAAGFASAVTSAPRVRATFRAAGPTQGQTSASDGSASRVGATIASTATGRRRSAARSRSPPSRTGRPPDVRQQTQRLGAGQLGIDGRMQLPAPPRLLQGRACGARIEAPL